MPIAKQNIMPTNNYYFSVREKALTYQKEYYHMNKESIQKYNTEYYKANREKIRASQNRVRKLQREKKLRENRVKIEKGCFIVSFD